MLFSAFKTIRSQRDLHNTLGLLDGISKEHGTPLEHLLQVTGTEFEDLSYVMSTSRAGFVHTNWFVTKEETGVGLVKSLACSNVIHRVTPSIYSQFLTFHQACWLAVCSDTTYDLLLYDKVVLSGILSYDVLQLSDCLVFLQLDTATERFVICCNAKDLNNGIFCPTSEDSFKTYYSQIVSTLGYQGDLDEIPISQIIGLCYEVCNCIFQNGNYRALEVISYEI